MATDPGQVRNRRAIAKTPKRSPSFVKLAIQLSLDPSVTWLEYVESLLFAECTVMVEMLVADNDEGRVAFDIVDERPVRDIDAEGLLLLALEHHQIRIVEIDSASINDEPRANNSLRIWRHRGLPVEKGLVAKIDRALAGQQSVSIQSLGTLVGLSDPLAIASALISRVGHGSFPRVRIEFASDQTMGFRRHSYLEEPFGSPAVRKKEAMSETWQRDLKDWTRVAQEDPC